MASPGNRHCANCIGTHLFPMVSATLDLRLPSQRRASLPFDQYLVILLCDDRDTYV